MDSTDLQNVLEANFLLPPTDPDVLQDWLLEQQERLVIEVGLAMERLASRFLNLFIDSLTSAGDYTIVSTFLEGWQGYATTSLGPQLVGMWTSGAVEAWVQAPGIGTAQTVAERWAPVINDNAIAYGQNTIPRIVNAGQDTLREVQNLTLNKLRTGQDPRQLRADIQDTTGFARSRASTIARTEVIGAYNNGNMAGARELGELGPVKKEWSSFIDGRTRPSHIVADGQTVAFEDMFDVDGEIMDAPHDPAADPAETINCRCQVILLYDGDIDRDGNVVSRLTSAELAQEVSEFESTERMVEVDGLNGKVMVPEKYLFKDGTETLVDYGQWARDKKEKLDLTVDTLVKNQSAISAEAQQSAAVYQSAFGMFRQINDALRISGANPVLDLHRANLDSMFVDRLPSSVSLYRGRQFENAKQLTDHMKGLTAGAQVSDAAYFSTSVDSSIASTFAGSGKRPAIKYEVRAKAGSTKYRVLEGTESEVLLPRDTKFKVLSVQKGVSVSKFDVWDVVLEVVE